MNILNQLFPDENLPEIAYLAELRSKLATHKAFDNNQNTHLEKLAQKYGVSIVWCPKFHCELNPIEGVWCFLKQYVRKNNDQIFEKLNGLIIAAIGEFKKAALSIKLWNRFWLAIDMYYHKHTYQQVLEELFGAKSSFKIVSHKKVKNFNTNLK